jgi:hypothetical protein
MNLPTLEYGKLAQNLHARRGSAEP